MKRPTNSSDIITKLVTLVFSDSFTCTLSFHRVSAVCIIISNSSRTTDWVHSFPLYP